MNSPRIIEPGRAESLKAGVHCALGGLAVACFAYNAAAWLFRRKPHLLANAVAYGLLIILEADHVYRHWHSTHDK